MIDVSKVPSHIAIIMDGNGRWAKKRGLPRVFGHREGVKAVKRTIKAAAKLQVKYLTLYAFSTENWKRPQAEVSALMELLALSVDKYLDELHSQSVRLRVIGDMSSLPDSVQRKMEKALQKTKTNEGLNLVLALNYGGQNEIVQAVQKIIKEDTTTTDVKQIALKISEKSIEKNLYTADIPKPDLLIRTSGEQRLSNFLLWQSAYSELLFVDDLWPDFGEENLIEAIENYQNRERRFGGV